MNKQSGLRPIAEVAAYPVDGYGTVASEEASQLDLAATLRTIWAAVYRNRLMIISIIGATMLLGVVVTMLQTPKYEAAASIQIDQQTSKVLGTEDTATYADIQDADRFLQTQVDVLKSRAAAERVADSLNLSANDNFVTAMGVKPADKAAGRLTLDQTKREQLIKVLMDNFEVTLPRNSRVASLSFTSPSANLAAQVANSFASNFIMMNLKRKFDESSYARDFLQQQLVGAKQRLEESERAMLDYSRDVGLIDASAGVGATSDTGETVSGPRSLVTSDLVALNAAYAQAQAIRVQTQQRWQQASHSPLLELPEVLTNPAISQLMQLRAQAQAAYDQDRLRHKPDYPALQQLGAQITGYDQQITGIAQAIRDSIRGQFETAQAQESALVGSVDQLKRDTLAEQDKSVRYNILKRETDTNRTMYDGLLQRYKEVSAEAGISANNLAIIDVAEVPSKPVSPRVIINLAISVLLGLIIATATVVIREKFDDAVRSPEDVPNKLNLPLLNSVPLLRQGETPQEMLSDPRSALSESYAALRTSLELIDGEGMPETLLFTSSRSGEGKSTSAYAIARDFARLGKSVVLIDGDLRRSSLHRVLGLPNNSGLASLLARHRGIDDVIQTTETPNLFFLSAGPMPPSPAELLSGPMLRTTLAQLHERYDLVVIDGPPVLGLADAVLLANVVDGVVFVIEANGSHHGQAKAALRRLQTAGANILGVLLTKYDARKVGYGYEYGYYSYNYGLDTDAKRQAE